MSEILGIDTDNYAVQKIKSTGGGSATLQSKFITITKNGTININPDEGYDGLSSVAVNTNVSGGDDVYDYFTKTLEHNGSSGIGILQAIKTIPSDIRIDDTNMQRMFTNCVGLITLPATINTSDVTNMSSMCSGCTYLTAFPLWNTGKVVNFNSMCYNCSRLVNVPVLNTSSGTNFGNMFGGCSSLSNESLNNILQMAINATSYGGEKILRAFGLTQAQATTCQSLSNWGAFVEAGWTSGY